MRSRNANADRSTSLSWVKAHDSSEARALLLHRIGIHGFIRPTLQHPQAPLVAKSRRCMPRCGGVVHHRRGPGRSTNDIGSSLGEICRSHSDGGRIAPPGDGVASRRRRGRVAARPCRRHALVGLVGSAFRRGARLGGCRIGPGPSVSHGSDPTEPIQSNARHSAAGRRREIRAFRSDGRRSMASRHEHPSDVATGRRSGGPDGFRLRDRADLLRFDCLRDRLHDSLPRPARAPNGLRTAYLGVFSGRARTLLAPSRSRRIRAPACYGRRRVR
jgi:hypothetical protein